MNLLSLDSPEAKRLRTLREKLAANRQVTDALGAARLTDAEIATRISHGLDEFTRFASDQLGQLAFDRDEKFPAAHVLSETLSKPAGLVARVRKHIEPDLVAAVIAEAGEVDAVSETDREKRRGALNAERAKLERDEERETLRLEAAGHVVQRRPDVDVDLLFSAWEEELSGEQTA